MRGSRRFALIFSAMLIAAWLTGCMDLKRGQPALSTAPPADSSSVELVWHFPMSEELPELPLVQTKLNEYTLEKLGFTVRLKPVSGTEYNDKMRMMMASKETMDIIWASHWLHDYRGLAKHGTLIPLDELVEKHAPELRRIFSDQEWEAAKVDGQVYGIPSLQVFAKQPGLVVQKRFADQYHLKPEKIKKIEDIEPFLQQVKAGHPEVTPFGVSLSFWVPEVFGYDEYGGAFTKIGEPRKHLNYLETEGYKRYLRLARDWYLKGYVNENASTVRGMSHLIRNGNVAVHMDYTLKPGGELEEKLANGGHDVLYIPLTEPKFTGVDASMNGVHSESRYPAQAVRFLKLVNTDPELFNLLKYGVEGKHYEKVGPQMIRRINGGGYWTNAGWVFGNETIGYLVEGMPVNIWKQTQLLNRTAKKSPNHGFFFQGSEYGAEFANISSVALDYSDALSSGSVDIDKYFPEYVRKYKQAGADITLKAVQEQLDAFWAGKGNAP